MINIDKLDSSSSQWNALLANKKPMKFSSYSVHFNFSFSVFSFHDRQYSSIKAKCLFHESMALPRADHNEIRISTKQSIIHRDVTKRVKRLRLTKWFKIGHLLNPCPLRYEQLH